jgi:nucleotide-binding universal stress UspA family protein
MTTRKHKKILLAVDGSDYALGAVRYVSNILPPRNTEVVMFHVHNRIPESYWDLEREASPSWRVNEVRAWEREYEKTLREYMEKAKGIPRKAGFPEDSIKLKIPKRQKGIARDIVMEAKSGYNCVVVGRRGMSKLKDLVLGSISTKLTERLDFVPLIVVGKEPDSRALLLALDGSENSMRAVDFVGAMVGGDNREVGLIHVIRGKSESLIKEEKERISAVFDEARARLIKSGLKPYQIKTSVITGAQSRAGAIFQEAKLRGYGTIVVGRKGLSKVREFFMGRVSNKVINMAKKHAVWVVN